MVGSVAVVQQQSSAVTVHVNGWRNLVTMTRLHNCMPLFNSFVNMKFIHSSI